MQAARRFIIETRMKRSKKPNAKLAAAQAAHAKWLAKMNITKPTQKVGLFPDLSVESKIPLGNQLGNGFKTGVFENVYRGREKPEVVAQIEDKKKRIAPLFNKGGLQFIDSAVDPKTIGRKV
jgi:hypothetical protein